MKIEEAPTTTWTRCELTDSFWQLISDWMKRLSHVWENHSWLWLDAKFPYEFFMRRFVNLSREWNKRGLCKDLWATKKDSKKIDHKLRESCSMLDWECEKVGVFLCLSPSLTLLILIWGQMKVINNYGFTTRLVYCWEKPSPFPLVYNNCLSLICLYRLKTNQFKKRSFHKQTKNLLFVLRERGLLPILFPVILS